MRKNRQIEDIKEDLYKIQTKLLMLEEENRKLDSFAIEALDLYRSTYISFRELEYYPLSVKDEMKRLEDLEELRRNEQLFDTFITERKSGYKKEMRILKEKKEELLYEQRYQELQEEEDNGN